MSRDGVKNLVMTLLMGLALVIVGGLLVLVLITVVGKGIGIVFHDFPAWFTEDISASTRTQGGGMSAAIVGTLLITAAATAMAVPLGIGGAVYLNEYGRTNPFARLLRFLTNVMTGVPSVVMGLFIFVSWVLLLGQTGISAFSGRPGARLPDAADRGAFHRGDAEAGASAPARRQLRARRHPQPHDD